MYALPNILQTGKGECGLTQKYAFIIICHNKVFKSTLLPLHVCNIRQNKIDAFYSVGLLWYIIENCKMYIFKKVNQKIFFL